MRAPQVVVMWSVCTLAGCVTRSAPSARGPDVRIDGAQQVARAARPWSEFAPRAKLALAQGTASLDRLVALFPEQALQAPDGDEALLVAVAASYDRTLGGGDAGPRLQLRASRRDRVDGAAMQRLARTVVLRGAHHVALVAMVLQPPSTAEAWSEAVLGAGRAADPDAWQALLATRPVGAAWPAMAAFADEATLRLSMVEWWLARGDTRIAMTAALQAEADASADVAQRLRLARARALAAEARRAEALLVLDPLQAATAPAIRAEALAVTGAVLGDLEDLKGSIDVLERAVQIDIDWPGRGRAMADLGVALLRDGQAERGVEMLVLAAGQCRSSGDHPGLVRTLRNHAAWLRLRGKVAESDALAREADRLAVEHGVLP